MSDVKRGGFRRKQGWYVVRTTPDGQFLIVEGPCTTAPKLSTLDDTKVRYWSGSGGWLSGYDAPENSR